jgi:methyl-accepting chemotaxis protein
MQWFHKLRLTAKLILSFLIVAAIGAGIGALGIFHMSRLSATTQNLYTHEFLSLKAIQQANIHLLSASRAQIGLLSASTLGERQRGYKEIETAIAALEARMAEVKSLLGDSAEGKKLYQQYLSLTPPLKQRYQAFIPLVRKQSLDSSQFEGLVADESAQLVKDSRALEEVLEHMVSSSDQLAKASMARATETYEMSRLLMVAVALAGVGVSIALGLGAAYFLGRELGGEPKYALQVVGAIARGDLTVDVRTRSADKRSLLYSIKQMQQQLTDVLGKVHASSGLVASASVQIAAGNRELSQRTEEQASSLEQTAASMEELTSTVKQNADNARQANQLAISASDVAVKGGSAVGQVVDTMASINASSRKIVDIISVIDGIAFQTNILALNAAVEAARAGEQGRGFAVVASEVRSLAQRSAAAAKEIKVLIGDSVGKVEEGSKQVAAAGKTMEEIVGSVKRVTDIMGEITAASQEQTSGIEQVNQAIAQMDQATQQNAALVEQASTAAQSLQEQADSLVEVIGVFKIDREPASPVSPNAPARRARDQAPRVQPAQPSRAKQLVVALQRKPAAAGGELATAGGGWETF